MADNKFYYNLNEDLEQKFEDFKKYEEKYVKGYHKINFVININLNNTKEDFLKVFNYLKSKGINPHNIEVNLISQKLTFTQEELEKIKNLEKYFRKLQIQFGLENFDYSWNANEITKANKKVKSMANAISSNKLSPLEKLLETYLYVTCRAYNLEGEDEHYSLSRSIYGIFNTNKICCVGYSSMLAELIENIKDENIKVYQNTVAISEDNKTRDNFHANLIVHIKDEKYNLNGYYYLDPTWDAGHMDKYIPKIRYFLVPLCDIDKIIPNVRDALKLPKKKILSKAKNVKPVIKSRVLVNKPKNKMFQTFFSSDGFKFDKRFLEDFISLYPEYFNKLNKGNLDAQKLKDKLLAKLHKNNSIYNFINKTSEPIDIHCLAFALKNVYKKENPNYTDEKLYRLIKTVMQFNCKTIKRCFKSNAKNCFTQYSKIFEKPEDFML